MPETNNYQDQILPTIPGFLLGAIAGDVIGSVYEHHPAPEAFPLFSAHSRLTDDSVLTLAVADALVNGRSYTETILAYARQYPRAGYGGSFITWLQSANPQPYNSFGNGSAMRVSPVAWAFDSIDDVLREAECSAAVTHNHPEGIKGAQAVALAIFLARTGANKAQIHAEIVSRFSYDLSQSWEQIRRSYHWDVTCQGSVPQSIISFLESSDFEDAIRKAILLGGDADTMAAIAGSIAEAYYGGIPEHIGAQVWERIPPVMREILLRFNQRFA